MAKMSGWMLKTETGKRLEGVLLEHHAFATRPKMADEAVKLLSHRETVHGATLKSRATSWREQRSWVPCWRKGETFSMPLAGCHPA